MSYFASAASDAVKVVVVGAGGLAAPFCYGLLSGLNLEQRLDLLIIDHDQVELSNLNRQFFFTAADAGRPKAKVLAERLRDPARFFTAPVVEFSARGACERLTAATAAALLDGASLVVDATDCTETKFFLNDYCVSRGIPYCYGGAVASRGLVLFSAPNGSDSTACLRCLFGDFSAEDYRAQTTTCRQAGIFGPVVGIIGLTQADLACRYFNRLRESQRASENAEQTPAAISGAVFVRLDAATNSYREMPLAPSIDCPLGCFSRRNYLLDIVKDLCPSTYLYTKLALEKISGQGTLDVRLGNERSARNVLQTLTEDGFEPRTLGRPRTPGASWRILIDSRKQDLS